MTNAFAATSTATKPAGRTHGNPFDLNDDRAYEAWRDEKLGAYPTSAEALKVQIGNLAQITDQEKSVVVDRCRQANMAVYDTAPESGADDKRMRAKLKSFSSALGLQSMESHRSAEDDGIVAIEVTSTASKRGFIPYTKKALSWHTDGYYNPSSAPIRAMLLHCVRPAREGGVNALLDPDIAYIRLRDKGRALIAAMMHPEAMTIPESQEEDGSVRPTSTGPVFLVEPSGGMTMRYTARTRNIIWRDDEDTRAAVSLLDRLLAHEEEPLIIKYKLAAGEGLISNNVLHTRTAFENDESAARLLYRVRYGERIAGT